MLKQLRRWGQIVAWSGAGSLLATFALTGVTWETPWRVIVERAAVGFVFSTCCIALAGITLPRLVPITRRRFPFPFNWAVVALTLIGVAMTGCAVAVLILAGLGHIRPDRMLAAWVISLRTATYFTLLFGIMGAIIGELRARLDRATVVIRTKEHEEERARLVAAEARLASLESRVNPHFLFNTLNSIAALTHSDPAGAERMTNRLASLMRSSLDGGSTPLVTLDDELRLVRDYLEIERVRFGDRLQFTIDIDERAQGTRVPRLSLQTLVENSVKFAVNPRREGGCIAIRTIALPDAVRLDVEDDGPGFDSGLIHNGHGLALLRSRLDMNFSGRARLDIESRPGRTCATIEVPRRDS